MQVDIGQFGSDTPNSLTLNVKQIQILEKARQQWDHQPELREQYCSFEQFVRSCQPWSVYL
ncbi:MAG: hypothetical protein KZQ77_18150 [Candidatus Thiodiazotropha sp. (ex Notomyrtea botanica)]|nr:hypothetical protein [Candidatus Thiodiazotropha sp. (ex Notomyrtea botanica)]